MDDAPLAPPVHAHPSTLIALALFTMISLGIGWLANPKAGKGMFLRKYFLGDRGLGPFAVALTAAVMSGGTFMGFPSLVYSFGWIVALWICSYMVYPLTVLGGMGKRIGQLSRRTGALTLPDLLRERYESPRLGIIASLIIIFFLICFLVPQFKAGALIIKLALPASLSQTTIPWLGDSGYLLGLLIFSATVIAYTTYGGFLAAVWTDIFQSVIMAVGVLILLPLAWTAAGGIDAGTAAGVAQIGPGYAFGPGAGRDFLPWTMAVSFFFMWAITGMGQPSTVVRLMAFRDSKTLRHAIIWLTLYNLIIYVSIILIFIAARKVLPSLTPQQSDEAMPRMVIELAHPYIAGLILSAPYGAVMSTVSGFLLIISSGLVRDIYERFLQPGASDRQLARASRWSTWGVGVFAACVAINPPDFLQVIVIFSTSGLASVFLTPALLGCYWRRATAAGALGAMMTGGGTLLTLYAIGLYQTLALGLKPAIGSGSKL